MSLTYKSFDEYRNVVADHLNKTLASRRDTECEFTLAHVFLFYSFTIEDIARKTTTNKIVLDKIGIMFLVLQDVLHGLVSGMHELTPVVLGSVLRISFEIHCNLRFIVTRQDPAKYADKYQRFADITTLAHEQRSPPEQRRLAPERRNEILRACPEWIQRKKNKDGTPRFHDDWNAGDEFASLRKRAAAVGLKNEYEGSYSAMSQFTHATARAAGGYRSGDGFSAIGQTALCKRLALLAAFYAMHTLEDAVQFFGMPLDRPECDRVRERILRQGPAGTKSN